MPAGAASGNLLPTIDWSLASFGAPDTWPLELKSAVKTLMDSPLPGALFVGEEKWPLYNDAFLAALGSRHADAMGRPLHVGSGFYKILQPVFFQVKPGEEVYVKDAHLQLEKKGDTKGPFDFAFKPLYDEARKIMALRCNVILRNEKPPAEDERFTTLIMESTFAIAVYRGKNLVAEVANDAYLHIVGKTREAFMGKPLFESLPETRDSISPLIENVMKTGVPVKVNEFGLTINKFGQDVFGYYSFTYEAARNREGEIDGFMATAIDITDLVVARKAAEENELLFRSLIKEAPVATCLLTGPDLVIELANDRMVELMGAEKMMAGKPFAEAMPEMKPQLFLQVLQNVFTTGKAYEGKAIRTVVEVKGENNLYYFDLSCRAVKNAKGATNAVMVVAADVTPQVLDKLKLEENEARLELLSNTVPAMIFYLDEEERYQSYNQTFMKWYGINDTEAIGVPVREFVGEETYQKIQPHLQESYAGREARFEISGPARFNKPRWLSIVYSPHKNTEGKVVGIIVHATDISESKETELALRLSEARSRSLIEEAPIATCLFTGADHTISIANEAIIRIWGKGKNVLGKTLLHAVPELKDQPFIAILDEVYSSGNTYSAKAAPAVLEVDGVLGTFYFDFTYRPLIDEDGKVYGIIDMAIDVTQQVLAQQRITESEKKFRALVEESPVSTCLFTGREMTVEVANDIMIRYWGKDRTVVGKPFAEAVPEIKGQPFLNILDNVFTTGESYEATNARAEINVDGKLGTYYFDFIYKAMRNPDGQIYGVMNMSVDVTAQVLARQKLEEKETELQNAIEIASLGTWNMDIETGVTKHSRRYAEMFGLEGSDSTLEETLAVVLNEDRSRVLEAMLEAQKQASGGRYEAEYRIRNKRDGKVYFIHSIGKTYFDKDGNAVHIAGTTRDVTQERELQNELATQVQMRTKELAMANQELYNSNEELAKLNIILQRSNAELEQFAYIASHDLQEPVRKISTFTQMLEQSLGELSDQSKNYFTRIHGSTDRMIRLIRDVLAFSQVAQNTDSFEAVDLAKVMSEIESDYELLIEKTNALITTEDLPVVNGIPSQLSQLFGNLLSNALKYTRPGIRPEVQITCRIADSATIAGCAPLDANGSYYHIQFTDNGIGFSEEHADRIFHIFQRLHGRTEYEGTGIGLSICRKILERHAGDISARPGAAAGAVFNIMLPIMK